VLPVPVERGVWIPPAPDTPNGDICADIITSNFNKLIIYYIIITLKSFYKPTILNNFLCLLEA
jgi:hypothetical protein